MSMLCTDKLTLANRKIFWVVLFPSPFWNAELERWSPVVAHEGYTAAQAVDSALNVAEVLQRWQMN